MNDFWSRLSEAFSKVEVSLLKIGLEKLLVFWYVYSAPTNHDLGSPIPAPNDNRDGIVNSVFDPIGLISPLVINLKVMMKRNYSKEYELQWDSDIPSELLIEWIKVLKVLVGTVVEFDRSYKPYGAFGEPDFAFSHARMGWT